MCTFPDCDDAARTYATRRAFVTHELEKHRGLRTYHCPYLFCDTKLNYRYSIRAHMNTHHNSISAHGPRKYVTLETEMEGSQCLFCGEQIPPRKLNLAQHIGRQDR